MAIKPMEVFDKLVFKALCMEAPRIPGALLTKLSNDERRALSRLTSTELGRRRFDVLC